MNDRINRRDFLKLAGIGGVVFASGLYPMRHATAGEYGSQNDFFFVQLSDCHWGYFGPANPESTLTLKQAVATVNSLEQQPDFIVFTGDLTHITEDPLERRKRLTEFKEIVSHLKVKDVKFMPGEHDASLDEGKAFKEFFGDTRYSFTHKDVNFIVVDNVSDPAARVGDSQLQWLSGQLAKLDKDERIVVFTHRPLFDLYPQWDWATRDGDKVVETLMPYQNVTVFYGHIHQENHHLTGHIAHHSAKSLMFPLPAPGSQEKRTPLPWDPEHPDKGLGLRRVKAQIKEAQFALQELDVNRS